MRRDLGWWYWFLTVGLLCAGLSGWTAGIGLAMILCVVQLVHVAWLAQDVTAFPVQVRLVYLAMLIVGLWEPLHWIHWMQLAGTSFRVLIGYCFLARTLSLAPWNRRLPLTAPLVKRTFLSMQSPVPPCSEVFQRILFKQVQG